MSDSLLSPDNVNQEHIVDIRLAASKMTGAARRNFMAEMTFKYCKGRARMAETVFGQSKYTVATGLGEKRTGITCLGAQSAYSRHIRWEEREPEAAEALRLLAESQSQQDPTFRTVITYTRLTAESALNALKEHGFADEHLPSPGGMAMLLNRMGYCLRKVLKAKPLKKIKETDAIFNNINDKDQQAKDNGHVKRVSMDCKAAVKIGDFSRGGKTRGRPLPTIMTSGGKRNIRPAVFWMKTTVNSLSPSAIHTKQVTSSSIHLKNCGSVWLYRNIRISN